jgi:hypothetical protein
MIVTATVVKVTARTVQGRIHPGVAVAVAAVTTAATVTVKMAVILVDQENERHGPNEEEEARARIVAGEIVTTIGRTAHPKVLAVQVGHVVIEGGGTRSRPTRIILTQAAAMTTRARALISMEATETCRELYTVL